MSSFSDTNLENPFIGLRAFEEKEHYLFFGRDKPIDVLSKKIISTHFLAVIGSSGSGKSSLVKSGLLPNIFSGFFTPGRNWRVALMKPGENPIGYLSKSLTEKGSLFSKSLENEIFPFNSIIETNLRRNENGLVKVYKEAMGLSQFDSINTTNETAISNSKPDNLLIVVDQFEELFRFRKYEKEKTPGKSDAQHFIKLLLTASQQTECPIYVLITMRSDFLGDCSEFNGLPEAINDGQYLVPRMTREEIRDCITEPVLISGATITPRLVTRLLNDIGNNQDQLPILQHAMMRTWDAWYKRNQRKSPIDFEDYEKIGTLKDALSKHANEAYDELKTAKEKSACELMFKALTDKAADARGIRQPRSVKDLSSLADASIEQIISIVEKFRKPGRTFLMPPPKVELNESSIIDISHESLMRIWDKLKIWTEEEAQIKKEYQQLVNAVERANEIKEKKGEDSFLVNPELDYILEWKKNKFNNNENLIKIWAKSFHTDPEQALDFLKRSEEKALADKAEHEREIKAKQRRRRINILLAFAVLGVFFNTKQHCFSKSKESQRSCH